MYILGTLVLTRVTQTACRQLSGITLMSLSRYIVYFVLTWTVFVELFWWFSHNLVNNIQTKPNSFQFRFSLFIKLLYNETASNILCSSDALRRCSMYRLYVDKSNALRRCFMYRLYVCEQDALRRCSMYRFYVCEQDALRRFSMIRLF